MNVVVVDYGMCNLGSVRRAFEECGAHDVLVSDNPQDLKSADKIVLPGVGAFGQGMQNLHSRGWVPALKEAALEKNIPLLGICLGMQLLADKGYEGGEFEGLGLIPGEVKKLIPTPADKRIPHVGWNEVHQKVSSALLKDIPDATDFYFVHSFHFAAKKKESVACETPYCGRFVSVVEDKNIFGVQFHPEKSQRPGFQLIRNFLRV